LAEGIRIYGLPHSQMIRPESETESNQRTLILQAEWDPI
jgi:hypothetical protein